MPRKRKKRDLSSPDDLVKFLNDKFGSEVIRRGSDSELIIERCPTGILSFDRLLGGGIPERRYSEIYGEWSVLKSLLATYGAAGFQNKYPDKRILWIDSEQSFDPQWVERAGLDVDGVDVVNPEYGEQATEVMVGAARSDGYSLVVVDSIAALIPLRELEYDPREGDKAVGAIGRLTSSMMRRLTPFLKNGITVIIINQMRDTIGGGMFAETSKPTGGRAIAFYAGVRVELRRGENKRDTEQVQIAGGSKGKRSILKSRVVNMRVIKDKCGPREGSIQSLLWHQRQGVIDVEDALLTLGIEDGIVTRNAASVTLFPNSKKYKHSVRGWDAAKEYLEEHEKVAQRLERRISKRSLELGTVSS